MILAAAVVLGLAAGLIRAGIEKRSYQVISLRFPGLVFFAFIPQWITFYQFRVGRRVPEKWVPLLLIKSQLILLVFSWLNRKSRAFWLLGAGLLANLLVIIANGGLMPITPEMVQKLHPQAPEGSWVTGRRLGNGKDKVVPRAETHLWFLSDRFFPPEWFHYKVAFSLGDVLIAAGAFWLLWTLGGKQTQDPQRSTRIP